MTTKAAEKLRALATEMENPALDEAVRQLTTLVVGFPNLADPVCGYCGWQKKYHIAGADPDYSDHRFQSGPEEGTPFFSEAFLYDLLGKEDARSVLYVVKDLMRAAGVADKDIDL